MDTSATDRWKVPASCNQPATRRIHGAFGAVISQALLMGAFSLILVGCGGLRAPAPARATLPPETGTNGTCEPVPASKPPEAPSRPERSVSQRPRLVSAPGLPAATPRNRAEEPLASNSRGAEKLLALNRPLLVRARESTPAATGPSQPTTAMSGESSARTSAPVKALIVKGGPPQSQPRRDSKKVLLFLGLGLGGVAVGVLARLHKARRPPKSARPSDAANDEVKMPSELELLMKQPTNPR